MTNQRGASVTDYEAPLFFAWQLTNRCRGRCLHCCEESGPERAWPDELPREESLRIAHEIVACAIPYAAFGGGEPLAVPHAWEVFEILSRGGCELKLETDGLGIDDEGADRLRRMGAQCVQISIDGASRAMHERVRPGGDFAGALAVLRRLAMRGIRPEWVFVPNRVNIGDLEAAFARAVDAGCRAFVTGPMMRLGRAAAAWDELSLPEADWSAAASRLRECAARAGGDIRLCVYPWDIVRETQERLASPQAMLLVVPNGKVKLLNALPFAPADLRTQTIRQAWEAYQAAWASAEVADFIGRIPGDPSLLRHANETWPTGTWTARHPPQPRPGD
ncbi:MAG: hypothetical protein A2X36_10135 [Elusimicrobia bacterium GWA2_69_24]|nr:MAG: hypothetical protein A2X36_10135 [Elusimicrobia bacterium GWA2_69_24]